MLKRIFGCLIIAMLLNSCVGEPEIKNDPIDNDGDRYVYILCEGLWGMDNSSLTKYNFKTGRAVNCFYSQSNDGQILGDIANHIIARNDTGYIAVSTAKTIEIMNLLTGKSISKIKLDGTKHLPREICYINDTLAFFSDLYDYSVYQFNPRTFRLNTEKITVGPAPEGLAAYGNYLFVANSGYGDYLAHLPKAGTISVIDINSRHEIAVLGGLPNVVELDVCKATGKLYASYHHLPKYSDSIGGIVEYDASTLVKLREWRLKSVAVTINKKGDSLFVLNDDGLSIIKLKDQYPQPVKIITNSNSQDKWYSLELCPWDGTIWLGNAKNYQISGEILVYDLSNPAVVQKRIAVGVNPNTILFK